MHTLNDLIGRQERVIFVEKDATVREAAKAMAEANVGCTTIMEGPHLVGLFTERDVLKRVNSDDSLDQLQSMTSPSAHCCEMYDCTSLNISWCFMWHLQRH